MSLAVPLPQLMIDVVMMIGDCCGCTPIILMMMRGQLIDEHHDLLLECIQLCSQELTCGRKKKRRRSNLGGVCG
jgi:hypothetical protein